jgi:hypothetical protein
MRSENQVWRAVIPFVAFFLTLTPIAVASTTWYVNGMSGNDSNSCMSAQMACKTIGHAISLASAGDSIRVGAATYPENVTIGINLKVIGAGASTTIIQGNHSGTVLTVSPTASTVTLSNVTISNGYAPKGGGIVNSSALALSNVVVSGNSAEFWGGGIYNSGTLKIGASIVRANTVSNNCYNICVALGGGIYNAGGRLTISNSTLSSNRASRSCNSACHPAGGGIFNGGGTIAISNSTLNDNSALASCTRNACEAYGGGIYGFSITISNSTLSGNSASATTAASGGGIYGAALLQNSIVAYSPSGGNCSGTMPSNGYNLSSDTTCSLNGPGDLNNIDPKLGPLQNNGGPTPTMALLSGSPAIDAGNPSGCTDGQGHLLKTDQRGMPRPDKEDSGGCDMGAYEEQSD